MAYGIIKIGEREVPMRATAATPIRYRQVFHKNLLPYFLGKADEDAMVEMVGELAYIMAKSAEGEDMTKLSEAGYVEWLEGFDALDLINVENATKIINFYQGSSETHETVKKSPDLLSGK